MLKPILFNVLGISAVVGLGTFVCVFIVDLLLVIFANKYYGVIFKRQKRSERKEQKSQKESQQNEMVKNKEVTITPYGSPTITPFLDLQEDNKNTKSSDLNIDEEITSVDFDKAVEEQKMLLSKNKQPQSQNKVTVTKEDNLFSTQTIDDDSVNVIYEDDDEDDYLEDEDDAFSAIIEEVQQKAMEEIKQEDESKLNIVEKEILENSEPKQEEKQVEEIAELHSEDSIEKSKVKVIKPKIIFKSNPETTKTQQVEVVQNKQEVEEEKISESKETETPVIVLDKKVQENDINEIRKLREDIFNLRVNTFKELKNNKNITKEKQQEVIEFEANVREKLNEIESLKVLKQNLETENEELLKSNKEYSALITKLEKEVQNLEKELATLKNTAGIVNKPYFNKEYYTNALLDLELQLKDAEKELRRNKREYNPLLRIKRTLDRDIIKLRRKEASVAKQKLKIYGVNNTKSIDQEKLNKLNDEVEILKQLKESVQTCETILSQNKERLPILEKENKLYTKLVETLKKDIENCKKAIAYYETLENDENEDKK